MPTNPNDADAYRVRKPLTSPSKEWCLKAAQDEDECGVPSAGIPYTPPAHPPQPDRPPGVEGVQSFNEETDPDCGLRYMRMTHDGNFVKRMDYAALDAYAKRLEELSDRRERELDVMVGEYERLERRVAELEAEKDRAWRQYNTIRDEQAANFEKWFGIIGGVGLTGYQPECATSMDLACRELLALRDALRSIADYGKRNTGHGYTCATMAQEALKTNRS